MLCTTWHEIENISTVLCLDLVSDTSRYSCPSLGDTVRLIRGCAMSESSQAESSGCGLAYGELARDNIVASRTVASLRDLQLPWVSFFKT